eukprot:CAMPEP_0173401568 /NCGR_PEP_ID=MMETSP1356-20130122/51293_1 /TAXON_ID=77927 ORGANISM="Hemiselmis virescens, Strain PCC157" /NCGR_SAMPLE_ID=MMETSP1356 /ASSEMBLY_ACC=CAM_ASM_000847 /LENGTH=129 /DNA_ID=CAMNT_0014361727 /DNA_START=133 /DNA_END=519 /DNA_ORIENTATION=-
MGSKEVRRFFEAGAEAVKNQKSLGALLKKQVQGTWIIDPDSIIAKVREVRRAEPNSSQKLRALHSIYHTTFTPGNRLLMLNTGVVDMLAEELRTSSSSSKHLMLIVGSLRNLSLNEESKLPMTQKGVHE